MFVDHFKVISMAIWQQSFWALPKKKLIDIYGVVPNEIPEDDFNNLRWFDDFNINKLIESIHYLPSSEHWNKKILFFGSYDSDSISITFENSEVRDIYLRIDIRNDDMFMLDNILNTLSNSGLLMLNEDLKILSNDIESMMSK